jgi:hypothetical protein
VRECREGAMIEKVHDHIVEEIHTNTKTDTIFVLTAILLNIAALGTNAAIAAGGAEPKAIIVIGIFVALILVVNFVAELGLLRGRDTRARLVAGLIRMYKDNGVDAYYDSSLLESYRTRYNLFMLVVLFTGLVAIVVPFVIM